MTDETTARDRAIEDARAWLQEIIDDRPEGAYEGAYDANDQRHARTVLRALAGAPTADVAEVPPLEAEWSVIELGTIRASLDRAGIPDRRVGAAVRVDEALGELEQLRAAAPEGVDAADERKPRLEALMAETPEWADDGMDLEAQGEMADQLAAAQAAIQRVRDMAARIPKRERDWILRALDGDTTETKEKR